MGQQRRWEATGSRVGWYVDVRVDNAGDVLAVVALSALANEDACPARWRPADGPHVRIRPDAHPAPVEALPTAHRALRRLATFDGLDRRHGTRRPRRSGKRRRRRPQPPPPPPEQTP